jgi:precorrin-4 C11-methyltransferase
MTGIVYFIGAGPGAPDLLTVRAERLIRIADVVIYADSLVHPDVARLAKPDARVEGSSRLTLEQMTELCIETARAGKSVARLQSGDPSVYGAMFEQLARLRAASVPYEIVPGVSSAFAAAALLEAELTVPGISQTVIMTRTAGRTGPLPEGEGLRDLARHRASLALFLSGALLRTAVPELIAGGYPPDTPAALVYRATWEDEQIIRGVLSDMAELAHEAGITKQALLMVGHALDPEIHVDPDRRSHLYDPAYSHGRRVARSSSAAEDRTRGPHPSPLPGGEGAASGVSSVDLLRSDSLSPWERAGVRGPRAQQYKVAIVAVSRPGRRAAERIAEHIPGAQVEGPAISGGARTLLRRLWTEADALILVMAAGAATRLIAPLISDKRADPGVVVVDDAGRFVISLMGGHRAESNELAERVATAIGAQAVTTTAAEVLGLPSVEALARQHGWTIENDGAAVTRLAAAIVNGERIGTVSQPPVDSWWPGPIGQVVAFESLEQLAEAEVDAAILVIDRVIPRAYASNLDRWVVARPGTLVAGVGCSTGAMLEDVTSLLLAACEEADVSPLSVASLATIDGRADEPALRQLADRLNCPLRSFRADELESVAVPNPSEVVRGAVGTSSVCEAAALLASGAPELLLTKRKNGVATVALARLAS